MLKKIMTVALIFSLISFNSVSVAEKTETIYSEDNTSIIVTADHPQFKITLKSNPTTGYSWFLREYDASLIKPIKNEYQRPEKSLIGASGFEVWTFKIKPIGFTVPHQTALRMVYARPWNKTDPGTQLVFHVTTQAKSVSKK